MPAQVCQFQDQVLVWITWGQCWVGCRQHAAAVGPKACSCGPLVPKGQQALGLLEGLGLSDWGWCSLRG